MKQKLTNMEKKKKVLILSGISWNSTLQRHHVIASWFAEKNCYDVYFLEGIISSSFTIKKLINRFTKKSVQIKNPHNSITILKVPLINPNRGIFLFINKCIINRYFKNITAEYDIVVAYVPVNTTLLILDKLHYKMLIYDCVRAFENWGGYPKDIIKNENKLVNLSNLILVDSFYLKNKFKKKNPEKDIYQIVPHLTENEYKIYSKNDPPVKIKRILYFGRVFNHLDFDIFKTLTNNGYEIYIVGSIDCKLPFKYKYLGYYSDKEELASIIINNADAIIIPYASEMDGVIPAKLMQSLATQLPVFINKFYDTNYLKQYLYVYESKKELFNMLQSYNLKDHTYKLEQINIFLKNNIMSKQKNDFYNEINKLEEVL